MEKLPCILKPNTKRTRRFLIGDSIEGWSDAVGALVKSYFKGTSKLRFDFSDIRAKGERLVTSGGKAPGPQPLKECLIKVEGMLEQKENGDKLSPIEVHDIVCHIADAVLAGGIRRAALISLFSADDEDMIAAKTGNKPLATAWGAMRMIVTIGWAIYPLGYIFGYLVGGVDANSLNVIYNLADFINKIAFGLVIWSAAVSQGGARAR